jgi:hypothetical protein
MQQGRAGQVQHQVIDLQLCGRGLYFEVTEVTGHYRRLVPGVRDQAGAAYAGMVVECCLDLPENGCTTNHKQPAGRLIGNDAHRVATGMTYRRQSGRPGLSIGCTGG